MIHHDDLYAGFTKDLANNYKTEAIEKWGEEAVTNSYKNLQKLTKQEYGDLTYKFNEINEHLIKMSASEVTSSGVQALIGEHYHCIAMFWGSNPKKSAYIGLAKMYVEDDRFYTRDGYDRDQVVKFLYEAMVFYAEHQLQD